MLLISSSAELVKVHSGTLESDGSGGISIMISLSQSQALPVSRAQTKPRPAK
jgi:hypothetical protein